MARSKTTTRSYTIGLSAPSDTADRSQLWDQIFQTHSAICRGTKEFGELFLNLRGGLSASLAHLDDGADAMARQLVRGKRRMLALGWLSVEDSDRATGDPHCVPAGAAPGTRLENNLAERNLRRILTAKGVESEDQQTEWIRDCLPALTANIRPDAVWINRADAFALWQERAGPGTRPTPEEAQKILFSLFGESFLTLPEIERTLGVDGQSGQESEVGEADGEDPERGVPAPEGEDDVEPSKASRGVFGDLFGEKPEEKVARTKGKEDFACALREFLSANPAPSATEIVKFRNDRNLPELGPAEQVKYPPEVSTSGAPTAIAKRWRKLLVCAGLLPGAADEDGSPRRAAVENFSPCGELAEPHKRMALNAADLLDACETSDTGGGPALTNRGRVFSPAWASGIAENVARVTLMPANANSLNEFKRLMFALAARRISQTQSWTRRNEAERHVAALRQDAASARLRNIDPEHRAQDWLYAYEQRRTHESGSNTEFRITKRMIGDSGAVFRAWASADSAEQRAIKTTEVQNSSEKFGDASLFLDIGSDTAAQAISGNSCAAEILEQWVKLRKAQSDQQRTKVPRFCHPDPFRHPTWCEFGGSSKPRVWYAWDAGAKPRKPLAGGESDGTRRLWMLLPDFDSGDGQPVPLRWRSKRLSRDLGEAAKTSDTAVPRADRVSILAAALPRQDANGSPIRYRPSHPFAEDAKGWNARLQADRTALRHLESKWDAEKATWRDGGRALHALKWFLTFAPELAPSEALGRKIHPKLGWNSEPHRDQNKKQKRSASAQLILSRLPGLRLISVDLGHRYAAACAVWEAITTDQVAAACRAAGRSPPVESDLYLHMATNTGDKSRTTVYRRIGADILPDGTAHPAPWARLERQFLIKLQGEQRSARAASRQEMDLVTAFSHRLGLRSGGESDTHRRCVDELMAHAVGIAVRGLKSHARRAKIAYALDPTTKSIPGIGGGEKTFIPGDNEHVGFLTDALFDWHTLATESKWDDKFARDQWNRHIAENYPDQRIDEPKSDDRTADARTRQQRHKADDAFRDQLKPIAQRLTTTDRSSMHTVWKKYWEHSDGRCAEVPKILAGQKGPEETTPSVPATGWHTEIRWITDWIMGKHLEGCSGDAWKHHTGGLSVRRITTMKSLYQIHKAFAMRARPDKPRGAPEKGESNAGVAQGVLTAMETMREQRVKQLASRIVEAALGAGIERHGKTGRDMPRPQERINDPRFATCHAVVIEDLTNYRPDEMRTRRENRQLMQWASSKVKKYLSDACQLHGLYLRQVQANYTSRQDSRTGAPGVRCSDVPVCRFMTAPWWRKMVNDAQNKMVKQGDGTASDRYLMKLNDRFENMPLAARAKSPPLRIPVLGGELFVSADPKSPAARGIQADLNAAANIGLKALLDPDWPGKWWYVPCEAATHRPHPEKTKGSEALKCEIPLAPVGTADAEGRSTKPQLAKAGSKRANNGKGEIINLWRDVTHLAVNDSCGHWLDVKKYRNQVERRVIDALAAGSGAPSETARGEIGGRHVPEGIAPEDVPW